jgi:hypothetical protein
LDFKLPVLDPWVTYAITALVLVVVVWRGQREERVGALVVALQAYNHEIDALRWTSGLPSDLIALAVFLWLALRGARYWTLWATGSVVLSLLTHVLRALVDLDRWTYATAQMAWFYVLLGSLLVGSLRRRRPGGAPADSAPPHHGAASGA